MVALSLLVEYPLCSELVVVVFGTWVSSWIEFTVDGVSFILISVHMNYKAILFFASS